MSDEDKKVVSLASKQVHQGLVEMLETCLEDAKAGRINQFFGVGTGPVMPRIYVHKSLSLDQTLRLLGLVELAKADWLKDHVG